MTLKKRKKSTSKESLIILLAVFFAAAVYLVVSLIKSGKPIDISSEDNGPVFDFTKVEKSYFSDALFIGDSRISGIKSYGNLDKSDFFCDVSLSLYSVENAELQINDTDKVNLSQLLSTHRYGKVYICFGANSLNYPEFSETEKKLKNLVAKVRANQPDAIVFINSCLHFTSSVSEERGGSNALIDNYNAMASSLADKRNVFYIDINTLFDVGGALNPAITGDGIHPNANAYTEWTDWLCTKGIVKENTVNKGLPSDTSDTSENEDKERTSSSGASSASPKPEKSDNIVVKPNIFTPYNGYTNVDNDYFSDALFIGDSRMAGLCHYAFSGYDNFSDVGLNLYTVWGKTISGKTLSGMLAAKQYGKIYIEFGANTLTYNFQSTTANFESTISKIRTAQPNAKIFIISCLHFSSAEDTRRGGTYNNLINRYNNMVQRYANNFDIFYIDVNERFDDGNGTLHSASTGDGVHPTATAYKEWGDWLKTKGVTESVKEVSGDTSSGKEE